MCNARDAKGAENSAERIGTVKKEVAGFSMEVVAERVGKDIILRFWGGETPHIGCSVLALPRPSLSGDGHTSSTSSVLNVPGHKDEVLCRMLAEGICAGLGTTVVCTGGFHADGISGEQIRKVTDTVREMTRELLLACKGEKDMDSL